MSSLPHPERFDAVADGWYKRFQTISRNSKTKRDAILEKEWERLRDDPLGLEAREAVWARVHEVRRAYIASDSPVFAVTLNTFETESEAPLSHQDLPPVFFMEFDEDPNLQIEDQPDRHIEGAYFIACQIGGHAGYQFVIVTDTNHEMDGRKALLGESLLEQTRVAIGFVRFGHAIADSVGSIWGDPAVCKAVKSAVMEETLSRALSTVSEAMLGQTNRLSAYQKPHGPARL